MGGSQSVGDSIAQTFDPVGQAFDPVVQAFTPPTSSFSGHCDGSINIPSSNINVRLADNSNSGTLIKSENSPSITFVNQEQLDLHRCKFTSNNNNKTSLPNLDKNTVSKLYNSNKFIVNNIVVNNSCNTIPRGIIIAWFDKTIPNGWVLCDGNNCTPDLRGRSILGFDSINNKNKIGQMGGEEKHLLTIGEIPSHNHRYSLSQGSQSFLVDAAGENKERFGGKSTIGVPYKTYLNETTNSPHNNMPPFVVCSYIMKL